MVVMAAEISGGDNSLTVSRPSTPPQDSNVDFAQSLKDNGVSGAGQPTDSGISGNNSGIPQDSESQSYDTTGKLQSEADDTTASPPEEVAVQHDELQKSIPSAKTATAKGPTGGLKSEFQGKRELSGAGAKKAEVAKDKGEVAASNVSAADTTSTSSIPAIKIALSDAKGINTQQGVGAVPADKAAAGPRPVSQSGGGAHKELKAVVSASAHQQQVAATGSDARLVGEDSPGKKIDAVVDPGAGQTVFPAKLVMGDGVASVSATSHGGDAYGHSDSPAQQASARGEELHATMNQGSEFEMGWGSHLPGAADGYGANVESAPGVLAATSTALEVGVLNGTHGWLRVRAEMEGGGVTATVSAGTAAGQEMLHRELPSLAAYLNEENIGVGSLSIKESQGGYAGVMGQGSETHGDKQPGQQAYEASDGEDSFAGNEAWSRAEQSAAYASFNGFGNVGMMSALAGDVGSWLNVRV